MQNFNIKELDQTLKSDLQKKIDTKTKPLNALGLLESIALQVGLIQNSLTPRIKMPHLVVFAGDNGIAEAGVSQYPSEVTRQMVLNFVAGGAAINIFSQQNNWTLEIVDAGVRGGVFDTPSVQNRKIAEGTRNFALEPAMTMAQLEKAVIHGREVVENIAKTGCNIIAFGEMGIGNTSIASVLMHKLTGVSIPFCVGRGTGLSEEQLFNKKMTLQKAVDLHANVGTDPLSILATFGGFETAMMTFAMLTAAEQGMIILVDGFIVSAALLVAKAINPLVLQYCIFAHQSDEIGHIGMLDFLNGKPILKLNMRLGEGTGAALALPILEAAVNFLNKMASFEEANVSNVS